jgi:hypothetical protein
MDVALYATQSGILLLVPDCIHPTREAERLYAPLHLCARSRLVDIPDLNVRARIEADIDVQSFAVITLVEAQSIVGIEPSCFPQAAVARA